MEFLIYLIVLFLVVFFTIKTHNFLIERKLKRIDEETKELDVEYFRVEDELYEEYKANLENAKIELSTPEKGKFSFTCDRKENFLNNKIIDIWQLQKIVGKNIFQYDFFKKERESGKRFELKLTDTIDLSEFSEKFGLYDRIETIPIQVQGG